MDSVDTNLEDELIENEEFYLDDLIEDIIDEEQVDKSDQT